MKIILTSSEMVGFFYAFYLNLDIYHKSKGYDKNKTNILSIGNVILNLTMLFSK